MSRRSTKAVKAATQNDEDAAYFGNKTLSDIKVKFSGYSRPAHKHQLAKRSRWFYTAFTSAFPVATSSTIDLGNGESPCLVDAMLRHIYGIPYDQSLFDPRGDFAGNDSLSFNRSLSFNLEIFILADKYDVPSLRPLATAAFVKELPNTLVDTALVDAMQRLFDNVLADRSLQEEAMKSMMKKLRFLILYNNDFADRLIKQELFDRQMTKKLLEKVLALRGWRKNRILGRQRQRAVKTLASLGVRVDESGTRRALACSKLL